MKLLQSVYKGYKVEETFNYYQIGIKYSNGVVSSIVYNESNGQDEHWVDVKFENGSKIRIFRPDEIEFLVEGV